MIAYTATEIAIADKATMNVDRFRTLANSIYHITGTPTLIRPVK